VVSRSAFRNIVFVLSVAILAAFVLPLGRAGARAQSRTVVVNGREAVAGEALVKFRTPGRPVDVAQEADADVIEAIGQNGAQRVHSRSLDAASLVQTLRRRGDVVYAEPNYVLHADTTPNDTYIGLLWGLINNGQAIGGQAGVAGADISADSAWNVTTGSQNFVVGVVDTGVQYSHPDLAANIWSAPSAFSVTIGGRMISCAAGTHGFNAIAKTCDPLDDNDHGTHVSGTIGAQGNNGLGVAGVNWVTSIMGLKFLDSRGSGSTADAINAIAFAVQVKKVFGTRANVRVLSNSWGGGGFSQALLDEINVAASNDMLFVAAAGNNGTNNDTTPSYPASYNAANIIAVAATDNRDALASFSNYGANSVDLGAPGVSIASTVRSGYAYMSGTSMATPHVSGTAALTLAACPSYTTSDLVRVIQASVDPVASLAAKTMTGGRLNAYKAVTSCTAAPPPSQPPPPSADFALSASSSSVTVRRGTSAKTSITITPSGGFASQVTLSASPVPSGVTASFSPNPASTTSTLTVTASNTAKRGTSTVTVTGVAGGLQHSITLQLQVR
jgi:subtilisin family serine protease